MPNNKTRGSSFERYCINKLKELGYDKAVSSRAESKNRDNLGVDICYTEPFNIQCKTLSKNIDIYDVITNMPSEESMINMIFYRKTKKAKVNFVTQGEYAILHLNDFLTIMKILNKYKKIEL